MVGRSTLRPDVRMLFQTSSIVVGFLSAFLVARGSFLVTPEVIARLASTYFGYNRELVSALAGQAAEGRAGLLLLVLSVVLQLPTLADRDPGAPRSKLTGAVVGVVIAGGVSAIAFWWASHTTSALTTRALEILSKIG